MCIGMATTFAYANSTLREQVSLKVSHLLNSSSMAALTNDLNLSGLKQHPLIIYSSVHQKSEGSLSSLRSGRTGLCSCGRVWRKRFPCLFQLLEVTHILWLRAPSSSLSRQAPLHLCDHLSTATPPSHSPLLSPSSTSRDSCDDIASTWIIHSLPCISRSTDLPP